jgi:hypothetical protein
VPSARFCNEVWLRVLSSFWRAASGWGCIFVAPRYQRRWFHPSCFMLPSINVWDFFQ